MTEHLDQGDQLARLVRDAADQVQPRPALDAIRARTASSPKESAMTLARTWILGGLGGAVATAAVIGGVYVATTGGDGSQDGGPVQSPSGSVSVEPSPSEPTTETTSPSPSTTDSAPAAGKVAVPVYYAGETPKGLGLYREFIRVDEDDRLADAVRAAINGEPSDPDYRSLWPSAVVHGVHVDGAGSNLELTVDLGSTELHDRPAGMSQREAELAIEQLIYTVQGAAASGRPPVQFLIDGKHTDTILGVPTSEPLANGPILETLSLMNLTAPAEGDDVTGDTLEVTGVANSFEANVTVRLQRFEGTHVVFEDFITAAGCCEPKLFPFAKSFDIADVPAGKYILIASTDDPSGGAEGNGPFVDSKVIEIK